MNSWLGEAVDEESAAGGKAASAPACWLRMATKVVELEAADEAQALGDTLPIGLQLR